MVLGQQKYSHLIFKNTTFFTRAHPRHYIPLNNVNHFIYPFVQTIYERVSKLKYDNTIFEMKFGRVWQIPQPLPKQKRYRNSPSKFSGIVLKVLCNMKRSADFGFLHSSVCVNIKLQFKKNTKYNTIPKEQWTKNMNNHSVIPKFLICWLAVTEKGSGCMWV